MGTSMCPDGQVAGEQWASMGSILHLETPCINAAVSAALALLAVLPLLIACDDAGGQSKVLLPHVPSPFP